MEAKDKYAFFKRTGVTSTSAVAPVAGGYNHPQQDQYLQQQQQQQQQYQQYQQQQYHEVKQPELAPYSNPRPSSAAPPSQFASRDSFSSASATPAAFAASGPGPASATLARASGPPSYATRPVPVSLPSRAPLPPSADAADTTDRSLRRRMASPTAAVDPVPGGSSYGGGLNVPASSPRRSTNGVATPGGNNVVFSLPMKNSSSGELTPKQPPASSSIPSAIASQSIATAASQAITNPFASLRGKRKHSDPDLKGTLARGGGKAVSWSARFAALRTAIATPMRNLLAKMRPRDAKKDDDVNATFSTHKFATTTNAASGDSDSSVAHSEPIRPRTPPSALRRAMTLKNIMFFIVLSLLLGAFYIWYTHDCTDEVDEDDELDHTSPHVLAVAGEGGHMSVDHSAVLNEASEVGGLASSYLGASLQEFEMMYPFLHPVLHFFKRPIDHSTHKHAIKAEAAAAVAQHAHVPFTLVSLLRDMTPEFLAENKASYIFQYNALLSWVRLTPNVLVYMDTVESCTKLTARSEFKTVRCFAVPCMHETVHRPLLNCIFEHSHRESTTEAMGFVNGDIILSPDVERLVDKVGGEFEKYLVVSRRTDTHLPEYLIDAYIANYLNLARSETEGVPFTPAVAVDENGVSHIVTDNVENVVQHAATTAVLHSEFGIDLFLYPKSTFAWMFPAFPPFLAGVYRWDNYFLTKMILHPDVSTIDASQFGLLVHQQVDGGKDHSKRTGAPVNDALVKQHLGSVYKLGHIKNVDYVLDGRCPESCTLAPNTNASVHVLYAKRANKANWMAIVHVNANEHVELNNFICWANRVDFRNYLFLTRDAAMYEEISRRDLPVIFLDRTLVDSVNVHAPGGARDFDSAASILQRYDFLFSVLRAGYHFFYASVRAIYLDDPLYALSLATDADAFDITVRGNATHVLAAPNAGPLAVRSTTYGQYFWKQVHDCADMNKHIADPAQWVDCVQHNWRILKGGVKKGVFDDMLFTDAKAFFNDKTSLTHGHYPIMVHDDAASANIDKFNRLKEWGLLATKATSPVCRDDLPSHRATVFQPPTEVPSEDFRLKVRVLTFNRHASLKRLLDILQTSHYDNDRVDLEISIDYPANMSDTATIAEWTTTQLTARSFAWSHGSIEVIQQRTHIGLTGQWTQGWYPPDDNKEVMLFLEDDTGVSPYYYTFVKKMIKTYYLNPNNYDPSLYGFALQTQHTILGETIEARYGVRKVPDLLNATALSRNDPDSTRYFRYQLVGTWGGVFFPQHWREFLIWLREKQFIHAAGVSPSFEPCVPTLVSNAWWQKKPHKVWSQWFVRFAFEKGWYNLYTNYPDQLSLVGNFREGGENFAVTKGLMNEMVDEINTPVGSPLYNHIHDDPLPVPVSSIPLYDFHFNEITNSESLKHRHGVWGNKKNIDQCLTIAELLKQQKEAANKLRAKMEHLKKQAEQRARDGLGEDSSILASFAALEATMHALNKKGVVTSPTPIGLPAHPVDTSPPAAPPKKVDEKKKPPAAAADPKKAAATTTGAAKADDKTKSAAAKKDDKKAATDKSKPDDKKKTKEDATTKKAAPKKEEKKLSPEEEKKKKAEEKKKLDDLKRVEAQKKADAQAAAAEAAEKASDVDAADSTEAESTESDTTDENNKSEEETTKSSDE